MSMADDERPYAIDQDETGYRVLDDTGQVVIRCRERASAEHYAELLTRAYRKGYRLGFRAARRGSDGG
ncbi:MAG: hypothetical protein J5I93_17600 [Pirellulaceae bacterium]|nr:hypothetical protein [Pirellulaceae bacterium]